MKTDSAYTRGVEDALALVSAAADSLRQSSEMLRLRRELAIAVLTAVAEEGRSLIEPPPVAAPISADLAENRYRTATP